MRNWQHAKAFNQKLHNWDVTGITSGRGLQEMFYLADAFNQDLDGWDVSRTKSMLGLFKVLPRYSKRGQRIFLLFTSLWSPPVRSTPEPSIKT